MAKKEKATGCLWPILWGIIYITCVWPIKMFIWLIVELVNSFSNTSDSKDKGKKSKSNLSSEVKSSPQVIHEKHIIKETLVINKIECKYCKTRYNEELDECPKCGASN